MLEHLSLAATMLATFATSGTSGSTAPAMPAVIVQNVQVTEGNAGLTAFQAEVSLALGIAGSDPYVVDVTTIPSSASRDDYVFEPVRLTFMSGGPPQIVNGFIVGDPVFEGAEAFLLHVEQAPGMYKPLQTQDGVVTIVDDDQGTAPQLSLPPPSRVPESNGGWSTVEIPVTLSAPQVFPVTFDFATSGGRASNDGSIGGDYRATAGTFTFAPGETVLTIPVEIYGDTAWEPDATFRLSVANVRGAIAAAPYTEVTITNDDPPTTVRIDDETTFEGNQGTTTASLLLRLSAPASGAGQVWVELTGGSALVSEDFLSQGFLLLTPPAGVMEMFVAIDVVGDTTPECNEGVVLHYRGLYMGDDEIHTARLTIMDDDGFPKADPRCPDPFVHSDTGGPIGQPVDASADAKPSLDAGAPPPDGSTPPAPNDGGDVGKGLSKRRGCSCVAAGDPATSVIATLLLAAAALLATLRRFRGY